MEIFRSVPLKTYFMFQPSGPYFTVTHQRVEEAHPNNNFLNSPDRRASMKSSVTTFVYEPIRFAHALRRLDGHLDAVLQDEGREVRRRLRRQPQPECSEIRSGDRLSHNRSSVGIRDAEVAVLQTGGALDLRLVDGRVGDVALAWPSESRRLFPPKPFSSARAIKPTWGHARRQHSRGVKHLLSS